MKPIKCELHEYLEDCCTIKITYHDSIRETKQYVKNNGIVNYYIEKQEVKK